MTWITRLLCAAVCAALLAPAGAQAHHSRHFHHFKLAFLKGTVASVDTSAGTVVVNVKKASRKIDGLEGRAVTVKVVQAMASHHGHRSSLADLAAGDVVWVIAKRRNVDVANATISAGKVIEARHKTASRSDDDGDRDGDDHDGDCDG